MDLDRFVSNLGELIGYSRARNFYELISANLMVRAPLVPI